MNPREFVFRKDVLETLGKLSRFDRIGVVWIDASQCSNVTVGGESIDNRAVETIVSSDGKFYGLQDGEGLKETYLLLLKDLAGSQATVQSIPLVLVREIQRFGKVQLMLPKANPSESESLIIRYPDGLVKRPIMIFR